MDKNLQEERLVVELGMLGVRYLSRSMEIPVRPVRSPAHFLADLVRQPSSRVRMALIAVLLAQPSLAASAPDALKRLKLVEQLTFKLLYSAAVSLQQKHAEKLQVFVAADWQGLPDLYSAELGIEPGQTPDERLCVLGKIHCQRTGINLNWTGSYEKSALDLLRRWEMERMIGYR